MEQFLVAHDPQLKSIDFPATLGVQLFQKLREGNPNDIDNAFEIKSFGHSRSMLIAKKELNANCCVYLVDHIWANDGGKQAYDKLKKSPELAEKLASIFGITLPVEPEVSFDVSKQVEVISSMCGSTKDEAEKALKDSESDTISALLKASNSEKTEPEEENKPKKKKDKCSFDEFKAALQSSGQMTGTESEAYLQKMYQNFLDGGDGCGSTSQYNWSDDGNTVTVFVSIPGAVKKQGIKSMLGIKSWKLVVNGNDIINGELYATVKPDDSYWAIESPGVLCMTLEKVDGENLWPELIKGEILLSPDVICSTSWLKERNSHMYLREILDSMWFFNQVYVFRSSDGVKKNPVWYIMDEYGSALSHGLDPNFCCSPFFDISTNRTYSLIWPTKDVVKGDVCQRNFVPHMPQTSGTYQSTAETYQARLKAFVGNKLFQNGEEKTPDEIPSQNKVTVTHVNGENFTNPDGFNIERSIYISLYHSEFASDMLAKLKLNLMASNEEQVDFSIFTLNDTSITIDGDVLPTCEMISNTNYLQDYLKYQFPEYSWFLMSYILPYDLIEFCKEFECNNLSSIWIVKQVNKEFDVNVVISSSYSRIVRMCEPAPIAVSKYIVEQPQFRYHRFALNYTVILCKPDDTIFIYTEPLIRMGKERFIPSTLLDEYDTSPDITERPERLVGCQDAETFSDFKTAMNKLLLPVNPDRGWDVYQESIFKCIGVLSKTLLGDVDINKQGKRFLMFGVDIIIDSKLTPLIVDINGYSNLPNKRSIQNILGLLVGKASKDFVQIS